MYIYIYRFSIDISMKTPGDAETHPVTLRHKGWIPESQGMNPRVTRDDWNPGIITVDGNQKSGEHQWRLVVKILLFTMGFDIQTVVFSPDFSHQQYYPSGRRNSFFFWLHYIGPCNPTTNWSLLVVSCVFLQLYFPPSFSVVQNPVTAPGASPNFKTTYILHPYISKS